jgi:hypothetical protein
LDKIPTREGLTTSLFPSPLTCPSLEDMAYMDEDNQNIKSNENEPDYEEIGNFIFVTSFKVKYLYGLKLVIISMVI